MRTLLYLVLLQERAAVNASRDASTNCPRSPDDNQNHLTFRAPEQMTTAGRR
jgi:hypothetical protein